MTWRRERGERLDALMDAHIHAGGPNQRRRWLTAVLSEAPRSRSAPTASGVVSSTSSLITSTLRQQPNSAGCSDGKSLGEKP
jgi:hypothetical protein